MTGQRVATLAVLCTSALIAAGCSPDARTDDVRPNIILIVSDDQGAADVSLRNSPIDTPHIDRILQEGAVLRRFYATPICSPTRAGILTGLYPIRFGMQQAVNRPFSEIGLADDIPTLPEVLAGAGYEHRHLVGKWHLGNMYRKHLPLQKGFTSSYGDYSGGIDYFTHRRWGETDWHRDGKSVDEEGYATDLLSREAVEIIEARGGDRAPFFLYLPFGAPHASDQAIGPPQAPEALLKKYQHLGGRQEYAAMVDAMDQGIGKILDALDEQDLTRKTIVMFMSDNGGTRVASNGRLRAGKGSLYEGGIRVLAGVRWPERIPPSTIIDTPMSYLDLMPTFTDAAGLNPEAIRTDGESLLPYWQAPEKRREGWELFSIFADRKETSTSLIRGGRKLLVFESDEGERVELYDVLGDPREKSNRAGEFPEIVERFKQRIGSYRALQPAVHVPPMVEPIPPNWTPYPSWAPPR